MTSDFYLQKDLASLYDTYGTMLYRLAFSYLQNPDDAADVVQDVFLKFSRTKVTFKDEEHEKAWFLRVATNQCHDHLRKQKIRRYLPLSEVEETVCDDHSESEVLWMLSLIPGKYRIVIILHYLEGYSVAEIASYLGLSVSAVKMRLARGRQQLEEQLVKEKEHV